MQSRKEWMQENVKYQIGNTDDLQLTARDINYIVDFYRKKDATINQQITIIKNGQLSEQKIIDKKSSYDEKIAALNDNALKYTTFIQNNPRISSATYSNHCPKLITLISNFLTTQHRLQQPLSNNDFQKLNHLIQNLPSDDCLKLFFDNKIKQLILALEQKRDDIGLSNEEVWYEINTIVNELKPGQIVGYVFTNNHQLSKSHIEVLLLTNNQVIKPIYWHLREKLSDHSKPSDSPLTLYVTDLFYFTKTYLNPQAGDRECGTLGLSCLRKLLRNNAEEYTTLSFTCSFYKEGRKVHFYFPPPSVLLYSQSSNYNSAFIALLNQTLDEVLIQQTISIKTLRKTLECSIHTAQQLEDTRMVAENKALLEQLPAFSQRWLAKMTGINKKRNEMNSQKDNQIANQYLLFKEHKFREYVNTQVNPPSL